VECCSLSVATSRGITAWPAQAQNAARARGAARAHDSTHESASHIRPRLSAAVSTPPRPARAPPASATLAGARRRPSPLTRSLSRLPAHASAAAAPRPPVQQRARAAARQRARAPCTRRRRAPPPRGCGPSAAYAWDAPPRRRRERASPCSRRRGAAAPPAASAAASARAPHPLRTARLGRATTRTARRLRGGRPISTG
jgi:hypothetical protein